MRQDGGGWPYAPLAGVRRIAVLRPNAVGDFVFALPALHALRQAYPDAELVLLGRAWHADFLERRPGPVDRVVVVPPLPGIGLPDDAPDNGALAAFTAAMRAERIDIACQMYGGGKWSNPLVNAFGARLTVGARAAGAPALDRWVRHVEPGNRRLALLEIAALAGAGTLGLGPELLLTEADRRAAAQVLPALPQLQRLQDEAVNCPDGPGGQDKRGERSESSGRSNGSESSDSNEHSDSSERLVVLQPGSSDPRRCWPVRSFALVGDALAAMGMRVVVNGTAAEASLVHAVTGAMKASAIDLSGKLGLGGLCGLLARAALVVSNDTGPLHLALALGRPCVGIFWLTNLVDGTPLRQDLLHAALSVRVDCPVCGLPNLEQRCGHDASFVADVPAEQVIGLAMRALARAG